ncbi:pectinesterase inhibitor domain containing protein precursor [Zea mays]|jgi:pectinesterase inhibitor-like protein|uniref:Pectinesterase inhibitor domain containing protein n=2 Tax=Zea mays TaxID=4577 RepID=B6TTT1_MAIZE|nr:pectinesterase inhibitor domain containing protein precursor [Zea mays]ACG40514.1 pectinesterase inhibitor domain containing protein [Zea mays]|eukprot:NP_001150812.1 pectinesterase inhibitor domain containing protein precursor [Zea mays]
MPTRKQAMGRRITTTTLLAVAASALCFSSCCGVDVNGAADTVAGSCDAIRDFVDVAFCASRLGSVPGAASADLHGHLLMAADLAAASGVSARDAAAGMARREGDGGHPAARDALEACGILYGAASVPALRLMRGYAAARAWGAARALLPLTGQAGIGCDAALTGSAPAKARMAAANREFDQLSTMATALLNKLA